MTRAIAGKRPLRLVDLELDLEVFNGPFDLLLTLILREEIDLLEVDLADVVISYIDHLESRGELDLEAATEFLVLITALLELKSRLMLPGEELEEIELDPGEAATELLERLLDAHRYRSAAGHLATLLEDQAGFRFRSAPLPARLRRAALPAATAVYDPGGLAQAIGQLLVLPPEVDVRHIPVSKVTVAERLQVLRRRQRGRARAREQVAGRVLGVRMRGQRPAAGELAQHQSALRLAVVRGELVESGADLVEFHLGGGGERVGVQRLRREEQQRLDRGRRREAHAAWSCSRGAAPAAG